MWPVEEDPMVSEYKDMCQMQGMEINPYPSWQRCLLTETSNPRRSTVSADISTRPERQP
jgi:hypothetical protein